jgi:hypothetical protein
MDPDAVTNFPKSDHRKSKFELCHGIKLGKVSSWWSPNFDFRKTFVIDVFLTCNVMYYTIFKIVYSRSVPRFHRQVPAAQTRTPADHVEVVSKRQYSSKAKSSNVREGG